MEIYGEISGHIPQYDMNSIQQIYIKKSDGIVEKIEKNEEELFILPPYNTVTQCMIKLPNINFSRDFGFYVHLSSNCSINEVEISFKNYLPIYTADGQLNGITSILFYNRELKNSFGRYIWLRRVSLNTTIQIAVFSIMFGSLYFLLSPVLRLKIFNFSSHEDRIKNLQTEFEEIRENKKKR